MAVGSYDTDCLTHLGPADTDSDCVRCICGITDDDGSMVQCDTCHFWLHEECVVVKHGGVRTNFAVHSGFCYSGRSFVVFGGLFGTVICHFSFIITDKSLSLDNVAIEIRS